ncbi:hypothetical protein CKM354_000013900 [Cercospora kikuchii]|uniref:F-box domain-containing protein n=1 Tax=Cercospora kikuchii TaxID=84275 RepID=A0A9P3CAP9_9PEZI|nr:uncharacterized protein CKM354_000013900 [Cercospora kikuchii]GIZ36670.1 hypothetical protein CKM354_000013900 [Cercospora kikuchii]
MEVEFRCVICGLYIHGANETAQSWLQEFRTVYSSPQGLCVTGVGLYKQANAGHFTAPTSRNQTWSTIGPDDEVATIRVMSQPPAADNTHGFLLHASCWTLLEKYVAPHEVDIGRLLELCVSVPYAAECHGLAWDHCYGDLIYRDEKSGYPWEDICRETDPEHEPQPRAKRYLNNDPCKVNLLRLQKDLVSKPPNGPKDCSFVGDCFAQLPLELREMIAELLTTQEVFNIRSAARSFWPIFESKAFWKSRFRFGGDREFLFEALEQKDKIDLRALWRVTGRFRKNCLGNRRRVWAILQTIVPLMDARITPVAPDQPGVRQGPGAGVSGHSHADISTGPHAVYRRGCAIFHKRRLYWPEKIVRIAASLAGAGGATYVSGFQFHTEDGPSASVGYLSPNQQACTIDSQIVGFLVAVDSGGLRAIRVLTSSNQQTPWLGDPTGAPVTERFIEAGPFLQVGLAFDAFKIVSIYFDTGRSTDPWQTETGVVNLRRMALWYPCVPPSSLHLVDQHPHWTSNFEPVTWTTFGGPRGEHLKCLTNVFVTRRLAITEIDFQFSDDAPPESDTSLGHCGLCDAGENFEIHGAEGEIITSISVAYESGDLYFEPTIEEDVLAAIKIETSWGMSHAFLPEGTREEDFHFKELPTEKDTIITGLYSTQHPIHGFTGLGVITETLPDILAASETNPCMSQLREAEEFDTCSDYESMVHADV